MNTPRLDLGFVFCALLALSACGDAVTMEGQGGASGTAGAGGNAYQVCTLGLCMDAEDLATSCQEVYDTCVGQGHYTRCCRMDADKTCGVFGETGPY